MASRSVKMSPKEFPDAFQSVQNKYLEPIWRQSGPNLAQHWCQSDLNWLQVGSKIGTSWSTKRQSRETAAFVVNSEPFWHAIRCDLGQSWGELSTMLIPRSLQIDQQNGSLARLPLLVPMWSQLEANFVVQVASKFCPSAHLRTLKCIWDPFWSLLNYMQSVCFDQMLNTTKRRIIK